MKELYSFEVKRKVKVEQTQEQDGKKIIETIETEVPVTIVLKLPSRKDRTEVQHFHQMVYSKAIKEGICTRAMIKKAYAENGGLFSEAQEKEREKLLKDHEDLRSKIQFEESQANDAKNKKDKQAHQDKANKLFEDFIKVHRSLEKFATEEEEIYAFSAENLARDKTIEWLICNLTFIKEGEDHVSPFTGSSVEEKNENYEKLLDGDEGAFYSELFEKASTLLSLWYLGRASTKEEFDSIFGVLYSEE